MADRGTHRSGRHPRDELCPELRRAVEGIVQEPPPEDLMLRALERARRQVAMHAEGELGPPGRRRVRRAVFWSLVAAASLGVVVLNWLNRPSASFPPHQPTPVALPQRQMTIAPDLPTAWAYHEVLGQSPEALELMLDRHARQTLRPEPQSFQANTFPCYSQPSL